MNWKRLLISKAAAVLIGSALAGIVYAAVFVITAPTGSLAYPHTWIMVAGVLWLVLYVFVGYAIGLGAYLISYDLRLFLAPEIRSGTPTSVPGRLWRYLIPVMLFVALVAANRDYSGDFLVPILLRALNPHESVPEETRRGTSKGPRVMRFSPDGLFAVVVDSKRARMVDLTKLTSAWMDPERDHGSLDDHVTEMRAGVEQSLSTERGTWLRPHTFVRLSNRRIEITFFDDNGRLHRRIDTLTGPHIMERMGAKPSPDGKHAVIYAFRRDNDYYTANIEKAWFLRASDLLLTPIKLEPPLNRYFVWQGNSDVVLVHGVPLLPTPREPRRMSYELRRYRVPSEGTKDVITGEQQ